MQFQHVQEGSGVASIPMKSVNIAQISLGRKWHAILMHLWFYHLQNSGLCHFSDSDTKLRPTQVGGNRQKPNTIKSPLNDVKVTVVLLDVSIIIPINRRKLR